MSGHTIPHDCKRLYEKGLHINQNFDIIVTQSQKDIKAHKSPTIILSNVRYCPYCGGILRKKLKTE